MNRKIRFKFQIFHPLSACLDDLGYDCIKTLHINFEQKLISIAVHLLTPQERVSIVWWFSVTRFDYTGA